jgi:hypothetical protein
VHAVTQDDYLIEGQSGLGAIPSDELFHCVLVGAARLVGPRFLRHPWRKNRSVLQHADGGGQPSDRPQACFRDAPDGARIDARTAAEWGLVNRTVPATLLSEETRKLALSCAEASSFTVAIGKQAFYAQIDLDQPKAYAYAKEVMSMNSIAVDAQEGISAFLEKRTPCWTGR